MWDMGKVEKGGISWADNNKNIMIDY